MIHQLGYKQLQSVSSGFFKRNANDIIVVLAYVDDIIFASSSAASLQRNVKEFLDIVEGTDANCFTWYLGIKMSRTGNSWTLSQGAYIDSILEEFGMKNAIPSATLIMSNVYGKVDISRKKENKEGTQDLEKQYRKLIAFLLYLSTKTGPDIATTVNILSQYVYHPNEFLQNGARRVLHYLKGSKNFELVLDCEDESSIRCPGLHYFDDADYAQDPQLRKSRSGFVGKFIGSVFSWSTRKQNTVSLSTAAAEYTALSQCLKEIEWIRLFVAELGEVIKTPTTVHIDNQDAFSWAESSRSIRIAKHVAVRHRYVKDSIDKELADLKYTPSAENLADGFPKPLERKLFEKFRNFLGVQPSDPDCPQGEF